MNNIIIVFIYEAIKMGTIASASLISAYKVKELIFKHFGSAFFVSRIFQHPFLFGPGRLGKPLEKFSGTKNIYAHLHDTNV